MSPLRKAVIQEVNDFTEAVLQKQVVNFLKTFEQMGKLRFCSIPNEGKRSGRNTNHRKGMGMSVGFPDLMVFIPSRGYDGIKAPPSTPKTLFLELKAPKGKLSDHQKGWQMFLQDGGFQWFEIRTLEAVESLIRYHLGTKVQA